MEPIELLMSEHRLIERVLDSLEAQAGAAAAAGATASSPPRLGDVVRFLRGYADAIHHGKEESILFAELRRQGCPEGLVPVLDANCREHETGRNLVDDLEAAAAASSPWPAAVMAGLQRAARNYVSMLRRHIREEDQFLFPAVWEAMSERTRRAVGKSFGRFEAAHAEQRRDLERLAAELGAELGAKPGARTRG